MFETINDLLFGIQGNDDVGRVNVSALTEDDDAGTATLPLPMEVSVKSFFPDLLAGLEEENNNNNSNNLQEPLLNSNHNSRSDE